MATAEWRFSPRTPTRAEKSAFAVLVALYALILLGTAPWAATPGLADPRLALVAGASVFVADICTALLLAAWYLSSGRPALLVLTAAYGYGAVMAGLHLATFPGALFATPLFGTDQTVAWLYLVWRTGVSIAYLAAVVLEAARLSAAPPSTRARRLVLATLGTLAACAALAYFAADPVVSMAVDGARWTNVNSFIAWACVALGITAIAVILANRAFDEALYLWLAAVIVAGAADLTLATLGGERYTLGWHLARTSFVVSSYLLLAFVIGALPPQGQRRLLATVASYGSALAAVLGALLLRWLLAPWLGLSVPYITLFGAIAVAVWVGGWRPALLATAVGYGVFGYLFVEAPENLIPARLAGWMQLALFMISSGLIIGLGEGMRRARDLYRESELELRDRAAQLQRADAYKRQFLAVLSHELRNPLAPLRNGLALLKTKHGAPLEKTVDMMERQIAQLTRLIDDLLDVSRIDRGKLELRKQRIALDGVARAAIETALPSIEAKHHELVVRYPGEPLFVDGDPVRLAQVIANLLNNAAKFTPERGRIELAMRADNGVAVLSVGDTGIGLATDSLEDVFEMFVQLDAGRAIAPGGLGLGLTLVRSLVTQHGGRVEARSAGPGRGAEFIVSLPLAPAIPAPVRLPVVPAQDVTRRRILVVDDNADAAQTLADLLLLQGHAVEAAHGGHAALRAAERLKPDVAFIDLNMPDLDGCEVARQIRATPWGAATKLVALTGLGQQSDLERTRAAGFDEHLTKPADPDRLTRIAAGAETATGPPSSSAPPRPLARRRSTGE